MLSLNNHGYDPFYGARDGFRSRQHPRARRSSLGRVRDSHANQGNGGGNSNTTPSSSSSLVTTPSSSSAWSSVPTAASSSCSRSGNPAAAWLRVYHDHDGLMGRFTDAPEEEDNVNEAGSPNNTVHPSVLALLIRNVMRSHEEGGAQRDGAVENTATNVVEEELPWWQQDQDDDSCEDGASSSDGDDEGDGGGGGRFGDAGEDITARTWGDYAGAEALTQLSSYSGAATAAGRIPDQVDADGMAVDDDDFPQEVSHALLSKDAARDADMADTTAASKDQFDLDRLFCVQEEGRFCTISDIFSLSGYQNKAGTHLCADGEEEEEDRRLPFEVTAKPAHSAAGTTPPKARSYPRQPAAAGPNNNKRRRWPVALSSLRGDAASFLTTAAYSIFLKERRCLALKHLHGSRRARRSGSSVVCRRSDVLREAELEWSRMDLPSRAKYERRAKDEAERRGRSNNEAAPTAAYSLPHAPPPSASSSSSLIHRNKFTTPDQQ